MSYFSGSWSGRRPNLEFRKEFREAFPEICLYDLGAAGGMPPPFLFPGDAVNVVTFEPDPGAEVETNAVNCPIAIGPSCLDTLYLNRRPTTSSLLKPNRNYVDRFDWEYTFPGQGNVFETVKEIKVETRDLDEAVKEFDLPPADFLKIDVQGLSLEMLEGAQAALKESVLGLQVEVEFGECYEGQKTFGAVHEFMYSRGFEVYRLSNLNRWRLKTKRKLSRKQGQDVFCDLTYFPRIDAVGTAPLDTREGVLKLIALFLLFDCNDAAAACLDRAIDCGLITGGDGEHPAAAIVESWTEAIDMFYHPKLLEKMFTIGSSSLLDLSPRKAGSFIRRKLGKRS